MNKGMKVCKVLVASLIVHNPSRGLFTLPGPDYFDEEAKCYGRLFEFCQVTFCHSRQWARMTLANF